MLQINQELLGSLSCTSWCHEQPSTAGPLLPVQELGETERREAGVEREQGLGIFKVSSREALKES